MAKGNGSISFIIDVVVEEAPEAGNNSSNRLQSMALPKEANIISSLAEIINYLGKSALISSRSRHIIQGENKFLHAHVKQDDSNDMAVFSFIPEGGEILLP